jgi:hypothetical protein
MKIGKWTKKQPAKGTATKLRESERDKQFSKKCFSLVSFSSYESESFFYRVPHIYFSQSPSPLKDYPSKKEINFKN